MTEPVRRACVALLLATPLAPSTSLAATLPPHEPLRVLIVSDEVNPHGLSDADLTQPGDLSAMMLDPRSGLSLDAAPDAVTEIPTDEIERATALLSMPRSDPAAFDVLVYFAHRIPSTGADAVARQDAFTAAVEAFLRAGGGMVSFHHGSYASPGKEGVLALIGAQASGAVPWDTVTGQDVLAVAPQHFACTTGITYDGVRRHADATWGIADADYPYFGSVPDERYPTFVVNPSPGDFTILFISDYSDNGTTHLLGFTRRDPSWEGIVVGWQPGEYQPVSSDPLGRNTQVLLDGVVFAANALLPAEPLLRVARDAPGAVLTWTGGGPEWSVHASASAADVASLTRRVTRTLERTFADASAGALTFYAIESR